MLFTNYESALRKAVFQPLTDGWFHSGWGSQYSVARLLLVLSGVFIFATLMADRAEALPPFILYFGVLFFITVVFQVPRYWDKSELGWDHRIHDESGTMYRAFWPWGAVRITATLLVILEVVFASLGKQPFYLHEHFYFLLASVCFMSSLYVCSCNRSYTEPGEFFFP